MKTTITLLLSSILLLGCGSRTKHLLKAEEESKFENKSDLRQNTSGTNNTSSVTDIRNFLINSGLKIKSTGQNYELRYGDLVFSGSADLEFTEKKEETIVHHLYQIHTKYVTETRYQTHTTYKTEKNLKDLNIERSGVSFGDMIIIVICCLAGGAIIWELFKKKILKI